MSDKPSYDLNEHEQRHYDDIMARMAASGGKLFAADRSGELLRDGSGQPVEIPFEVLRGSRYCVDARGRLWRYAARGSSKMPDGVGGGAPRRNAAVEMWSGNWYKTEDPEGRETYAKCLIWCPVEPGVNEHPNISHIDWYTSHKGFRHPHDPPHRPTGIQIRMMESKQTAVHEAVYARMEEMVGQEGMDLEKLKAASRAQEEAATKKRSNKGSSKTDAA